MRTSKAPVEACEGAKKLPVGASKLPVGAKQNAFRKK
jgi:hypothetical protein